MNFFDKLKAQVNMNDGGKTWSNPSANQDASQMPRGMQMRPSQPIQQFEDGSSLVGRRGAPRIGVSVESGQGREYGIPQGQQNIGPVVSFGGMQQAQAGSEDDFTPSAALENTGYINPQTTKYGYQQQDGRAMPQGNARQLQDWYLQQLLGY